MTESTAESDEAEPGIGEKVAFLRSADAYDGVDEVEVRETRMAWVFLAGNRVYKLKKPVRHPFLDYTTRAARRWACEEEVRLNRRLAPDVYLGAVALTRESDGALAIGGAGEVVDWLVEMVRLSHDRLLDAAIEAETVTREQVGAVADRLAGFYREQPPIRVEAQERVAALERQFATARDVLADDQFSDLAGRGLRIVDALAATLARSPEIVTDRAEAGRILEGHGDLKPEHVCLTDPPLMIDCLEFSRELRLIDPFDELSYLAMECSVLGARWIGPLLIGHCAEALGDHPPEETLAFYRAARAQLRARQSLEHLLDPEPRTPEKWKPKAQGYFNEAEGALASLRAI
jgi:aminoglycoside phosphotransferase family enzyme